MFEIFKKLPVIHLPLAIISARSELQPGEEMNPVHRVAAQRLRDLTRLAETVNDEGKNVFQVYESMLWRTVPLFGGLRITSSPAKDGAIADREYLVRLGKDTSPAGLTYYDTRGIELRVYMPDQVDGEITPVTRVSIGRKGRNTNRAVFRLQRADGAIAVDLETFGAKTGEINTENILHDKVRDLDIIVQHLLNVLELERKKASGKKGLQLANAGLQFTGIAVGAAGLVEIIDTIQKQNEGASKFTYEGYEGVDSEANSAQSREEGLMYQGCGTHVVQDGDSIESIANRYGIPITDGNGKITNEFFNWRSALFSNNGFPTKYLNDGTSRMTYNAGNPLTIPFLPQATAGSPLVGTSTPAPRQIGEGLSVSSSSGQLAASSNLSTGVNDSSLLGERLNQIEVEVTGDTVVYDKLPNSSGVRGQLVPPPDPRDTNQIGAWVVFNENINGPEHTGWSSIAPDQYIASGSYTKFKASSNDGRGGTVFRGRLTGPTSVFTKAAIKDINTHTIEPGTRVRRVSVDEEGRPDTPIWRKEWITIEYGTNQRGFILARSATAAATGGPTDYSGTLEPPPKSPPPPPATPGAKSAESTPGILPGTGGEDYELVSPSGIGKPMSQLEMAAVIQNSRRLKTGADTLIPLRVEDWSQYAPNDRNNQILDIVAVIARGPALSPEGLYYMDVIVAGNSGSGNLILTTVILGTNHSEAPVGIRRANNFKSSGADRLQSQTFSEVLPYIRVGDGISFRVAMDMSEEIRNGAPDTAWAAARIQLIQQLGPNGRHLASIAAGQIQPAVDEVLGPVGPVVDFLVGEVKR